MTELRMESYEIPAADLGPENPLPHFRGEREDDEIHVGPNVPEAEQRYMGWRTAYRVLPYRMQDGYNRKKTPRAFRAAVLENECLRATFLPELGGRLASLVHKPQGRELLEQNPVFQPANLALRNAWISGGIEWNTGQLGHYYLTVSPVFAARVDGGEEYPVLRIYEWDRVKCFPWQIDFHLPPKSPYLFAHVRLVNPHDDELAMYWWTNMGITEQPGARVLFPAATAMGPAEDGGLDAIPLPKARGVDATYATNVPFAQEIFARIEDGRRRWVACLDEHGAGVFETSTDLLRGRKMFCWGMNQGGRRWQEFLSVPGRAYLEIQAGLARTQLESLPMPARAEWTWTEAFGLLEADPTKVHSMDWAEAWQAVDAALEQTLPRARVEAAHAAAARTAVRGSGEILFRGSGWGALERRCLASQGRPDRIPPSCVFQESDLGPEQQPWIDLLDHGALKERNPEEDYGAAMAQPEWRALLEAALEAGRGDHWLSWLHLGIMRLEAHETEGARQAWQRSIAHRPSGWAYRDLAVLAQRAGDLAAERAFLGRAWETGPKIAPLAIEYATALVQAKDYEALAVFLEGVPEPVRAHERMRLISAQAALDRGNLDEVERLFDYDFASNREGEVTLTDLWFSLHEKRLAARENVPVDDALKQRVRREFPPPKHIDFRMVAEINE